MPFSVEVTFQSLSLKVVLKSKVMLRWPRAGMCGQSSRSRGLQSVKVWAREGVRVERRAAARKVIVRDFMMVVGRSNCQNIYLDI